MRILFLGDIMGKIGRRAVKKVLPQLKKELEPDLVMANAENLAHGKGVTKKTLQEAQGAGIDIFTSGNHIWKQNEVFEIFQEGDCALLRPANYPPNVPGKGYEIFEVGTRSILAINLIGRVFFKDEFDCPFRKVDEILKEFEGDKNVAAIIVDFHAEATSEKVAFGWYTDGRVSAVLGTHTHIPTADGQVLPQGTAYITDVGMVGAKDSVLGVQREVIIQNFLTQMGKPHELPEKGTCTVNAVLVEIDSETKKAINIKRIDREVEVE